MLAYLHVLQVIMLGVLHAVMACTDITRFAHSMCSCLHNLSTSCSGNREYRKLHLISVAYALS